MERAEGGIARSDLIGYRRLKGRLALAVWVTCAGSTEPVQAIGGWLMLAEELGEVLYSTDGAQYTESRGWT
ncbi:MAG: hypothetical protein HOI20_10640 [Gemmatimonadetes bacterium]|nr:hypothetical protein [Gemmatimonadota bacterium]MBT5802045.1 hypothetical protein [Gemmatimonadota bacterium]MBT7586411.1 hypothetical protein [Gemmatimonadota bacterium]